MSEIRDWAIRVVLDDGEVRTIAKPAGEADARRAYADCVRNMYGKSSSAVKVELLSRPDAPWDVVDSAEAGN